MSLSFSVLYTLCAAVGHFLRRANKSADFVDPALADTQMAEKMSRLLACVIPGWIHVCVVDLSSRPISLMLLIVAPPPPSPP